MVSYWADLTRTLRASSSKHKRVLPASEEARQHQNQTSFPSRRTWNGIQHVLNHGWRIEISQKISGSCYVGPILRTTLSLRSGNDKSVRVYLLCRQRNQRRRDKVDAMEGGEISAEICKQPHLGIFGRAAAHFERARNSVVAYGVTPPSTPLSMRRKATTS